MLGTAKGCTRRLAGSGAQETTMKLRVYNSQTGIVLWEGEAADEQAALDACARDAGYDDDASIPDEVRSPFITAALAKARGEST